MVYPHWQVEGRFFTDVKQARAFAKTLALASGRSAALMQKDDEYLPSFMLEKVAPN